MKNEPQPFANLDGILVVKALPISLNLGDRGVAHSAQNKLDPDHFARRGTHGVVRHIKRGQRRIDTAKTNEHNTSR